MARLSVRRILAIAFAAVALLPLVLFSVSVWWLLKRHLDEDTEEIVKNALRYISIQTSGAISDDPARMLPPILLSAGSSTDADHLLSILSAARETRPDVLRLAILDADRRILCAFPFSRTDIGSIYPLKTNIAEGFINHSKPFNAPTAANEHRMALEISFISGDRTVVGTIDLTGISLRLVLTKLSYYDRIGVVDEAGRYILCSDPDRVLSGERLPPEALTMTPTLIDQEDGVFIATSLSIPSSEWRSVYLRSKFVADAPVREFFILVSRLAALSMIVAAAGAFASWRAVTGPLGSLVARISLIADGRYSERVAGPFPIEFGKIAAAFNSMAESVEHRETALQRSEERYRLLFSENPVPAILADESNGTLADANPAAEIFYGYSLADLKTMRIENLDADPFSDILSRIRTAAADRRSLLTRHRLKSGTVKDVELYTHHIEIEDRLFMHTIVFDLTDRIGAEKFMKAALEEKEKLLKEIDHRVHNNQQMIVSLLRMQAETEKTEESRTALKKAHDRMFAMALAHDLVYQMKDLSLVDMRVFAERLVQNYSLNYGGHARTANIAIEDLRLDLEQAIPFALALNEFLSATLLDEAGEAAPLTISIRIEETAKRDREATLEITVPRDGRTILSAESAFLSVSVAMAVAGQLRGSASWFTENEAGERSATLRFPIAARKTSS